jgi:hypothetical protein
VAFACQQFQVSESRACKLMSMDCSTYRYEPRPDHNAELRQKLTELAKQKPRYRYRRLHVLLEQQGEKASPMRLFRLYQEAGLAVRRLKRKRLARPAAAQPLHLRANQEWALDFVNDTLGTGCGIRIEVGSSRFSANAGFLPFPAQRPTQPARCDDSASFCSFKNCSHRRRVIPAVPSMFCLSFVGRFSAVPQWPVLSVLEGRSVFDSTLDRQKSRLKLHPNTLLQHLSRDLDRHRKEAWEEPTILTWTKSCRWTPTSLIVCRTFTLSPVAAGP